MNAPPPPEPAGLVARLRDAAEEWLYRANERNHWLFRLYDRTNERYASLLLRGVRERASSLDEGFTARDGTAVRLRFLGAEDDATFAELLGSLRSRYLPPHPLDPESAARALRRRSYLPFGIFVDEQLLGYLLLRLFLPRRAVTGIWTLRMHNVGVAQECLRRTRVFTRSEGLPDYCTVPIDNLNSLRVAVGAGFVLRHTNRRFHVLRH